MRAALACRAVPAADRVEPTADRDGRSGSRRPAIYTRTGDDGTTGLLYGGRVAKDAAVPEACGAVDEAQAALGLARALLSAGDDDELDAILVAVMRDLWLLMAEVAVDPASRKAGRDDRVTKDMVAGLEERIDSAAALVVLPEEFVVPGEDLVAAQLDVARTVVRRAERRALAVAAEGSQAGPYLNRLSDLLWTLARWREGSPRRVRDV